MKAKSGILAWRWLLRTRIFVLTGDINQANIQWYIRDQGGQDTGQAQLEFREYYLHKGLGSK